MMAALLLHGPCSHHGTFCYVVDNPIDWVTSFAFPVNVVTFAKGISAPAFKLGRPLTQQQHHLKKAVMLEAAECSEYECWIAPFRWHWQSDNGQKLPYSDAVNDLFESHYDAYSKDSSKARFCTPPIIRFVDDRPQVYQIDFMQNRQINDSTGYGRSIERRRVPQQSSDPSKKWYYTDEASTQVAFDSLIQGDIHAAFEKYLSGQGPSAYSFSAPGRPEVYEIDFKTGTQKNRTTGVIRPVCRR
jgi:hypothetical protein